MGIKKTAAPVTDESGLSATENHEDGWGVTGDAPATPAANDPATALVSINGLNLFGAKLPESQGMSFPQFKIPYPVEAGSNGITLEHAFKAGLYDGTKFSPITSPYYVSIVANRSASRRLTKDQAGKNKYERAYASLGAGFDASAALYQQHVNDKCELGVTYIMIIWQQDGSVAMAECPCFKVMVDYFGPAFHQAKLRDGMAVRIDVTSHDVNQQVNKAGTGKYLAPKKFSQWSLVQLTDAQKQAATPVCEKSKVLFEKWCKQ